MHSYRKKQSSYLLSLLLIVLVLLIPSALATREDVVIINSQDWRDQYLASVYAGLLGYDVIHFDTLKEASLQTSTLVAKRTILVLESTEDPIVQNYPAYLKANDVTQFEEITFSDYSELQEELFGLYDAKGVVILDPQFGTEALAATPFIVKNQYFPLFYSDNSESFIRGEVSSFGDENVIIAGQFPYGTIDDMKGKRITDSTKENIAELTRLAYATSNNGWGIITRIDAVDLKTLGQELPFFIYVGDYDHLEEMISESGIKNFEVIDTAMADIAKNVRSETGSKINMMLKYARTFSNVDGMEGELLGLNTVAFAYPYGDLVVVRQEYYTQMDILALTFQNRGNVPVKFLNTLDFAGNSLVDERYHVAAPGDIITIPYPLGIIEGDTSQMTLTSQFGVSLPLTQNIRDDSGEQILSLPVSENSLFIDYLASLSQLVYSPDNSELYLFVRGDDSEDIKLRAQVFFNDTHIYTSPSTTVPAGKEKKVVVPLPYLNPEPFFESLLDITLYYGLDDTILLSELESPLHKENTLLSGNFMKEVDSGTIVPVVLLVVVLALVVIVLKRRKSHE